VKYLDLSFNEIIFDLKLFAFLVPPRTPMVVVSRPVQTNFS
jgi:hypothetical protein